MNIQQLIDTYPKELDLTNDKHAELVEKAVEQLLDITKNIKELEEIEDKLITENKEDLPIFILLAIKIAKSKLLANNVKEPLFISVVFAVYKEHNRIKKSSEHPHGEDFLLKKVAQLEWLFADNPLINWELIVVDDGCPEKSGEIAQNIIDKNHLQDKVRVLHLSDAIEQNYLPTKGLKSTNDSQKGGAILYGMWDAVQHCKSENHIVAYTDADLSTHLGQLMLLANPIVNEQKLAAIGSRREKQSVVIKKGTRNDRGKLFIYLWKRMIPNLGNIIDTQCGFKAFDAQIIPTLIEDMIEKKFAFDVELLLKTALQKQDSIQKVAIAWIDSEEASTTTDLQPYLPMLKSIASMQKKYFSEGGTNEFTAFVASLDEDSFNKLLENIPTAITSKEPDSFTSFEGVRVADLV
ncbi:MAG: hypothetical protein KGV44_11585 [Flavobacteriaceae bacterium]|nr:hypothetical protein [Flavobacteriaceae bacterium]